jgi:hypothetical protein
VQQHVLTANLTGWTQCSLDTYGSGTTSIAALKTACKFGTAGVIWLMGCRKASSPGTLLVAAAGDPADILFATSGGLPRVVAGTGIEWYFDNGTWGFAPANAALSRGSSICDNAGSGADGFAGGFGSQRLCWNTSGGNVSPGQRCGNQVGVADASFERIVFYK